MSDGRQNAMNPMTAEQSSACDVGRKMVRRELQRRVGEFSWDELPRQHAGFAVRRVSVRSRCRGWALIALLGAASWLVVMAAGYGLYRVLA